ncbi:MAG: cysteine--tRNA ligase [Roseofilum sp. SBFL]|uniref:cysteine--tRNA ligase n=1 Tax=unclassified Roseofilum TaxID=2620099 RepID=UPI001B1DE615|nr:MULTISPECIES: cysteine--tRNA ligase [unclassified Roseofilum]MBP0013491.1 cysteine--tRNA ligase [Roseofilum sp. SID3]MBP0024689.1 cysteine--tRNA ligase [Roseofilum sp. SID2]MBP0039496.1 cysteine--tRNA ligase [Roseofilum sp. SID1]MBP0042522.1 cysteine--tRNA ligase [Roseofilum sp. SBFL]
MTLTLTNTLTRSKQPFESLEPGKVRIYCCGVTVYDYCHLGHARSYIAWDTLRRYLQWRGYQVCYVQNFTDIDDKILNRARETGSTMEAVSEKYTQTYFEDMARLNVLEADEYPRATHTLDGILRLIHELEAKGYAYASEGDVYYQVHQFQDYGKLSGRKFDQMQAGASGRVGESAEDTKKKDPFDFALWKSAKPDEPSWDSPWGKGRPGWHIECSAMIRECFGETIDIHCGGADLVFPHHENEVAQSEVVTGQPLAHYWLHNGFVTVNGVKMSKSLGNFTTIRDLLDSEEGPEPMALRLFVLQAQYRKPIDFTAEAISSAQSAWNTLKEGLSFGYKQGSTWAWDLNKQVNREDLNPESLAIFNSAMDDDLNTSGGLAVLFELAKGLNRENNRLVHEGKTEVDPEQLYRQWKTLVTLSQVLGLEVEPEGTPESPGSQLSDREIEEAISARQAARKAKNFAEADRIRDDLQSQGITLIDQPGGITQWHRN